MTEQLIIFFADWAVFALVLVVPLLVMVGQRRLATQVLVSLVLAWGAARLVKHLVPSLRPFEASGWPQPPLVGYFSTGTFPSSHTAAAWAAALTVWLGGKRRLGGLMLVVAASIGLARVAGGVHYLLDVVVGAVVGSLVAYSVTRLTPYHSR